jgi:hypothetical protein
MKKIIFLLMLSLYISDIYPQNPIIYQSGIMGVENLKAAANLSPYSTSAVGFDTRYEGVKGTTRLFDTLITSYLLVSGQEKYIQLKSDIDLVKNTLVFIQPEKGDLMEISSDYVIELIVNKDDKELKYRTTKELNFENKIPENKFCQVLKEGPNQFIKIPEKKFVEADYKRVYSPDRRYDEFKLSTRYYIADSDNIFHRIQLNKKSLAKLFPDKKQLIFKEFEEKSEGDIEERVVSILNKF